MRKLAVTVLAATVLAGCAGPQVAGLPPEVTYRNVDADCVRTGFLETSIAAGGSIRSQSDAMIEFTKPVTNPLARVVMYSKRGGEPLNLFRLTFLERENDLKVMVSRELMFPNASGVYDRRPQPMGPSVRNELEEARSVIEQRCAR
jgi:hypothetical protein